MALHAGTAEGPLRVFNLVISLLYTALLSMLSVILSSCFLIVHISTVVCALPQTVVRLFIKTNTCFC